MRVRALYNDGRRAATHRVTVAIDETGLIVMTGDERRVALWPAGRLRLVERPPGRGPFRVACAEIDGRLTFAAPVLENLHEYYPRLPDREGIDLLGWAKMAGWAAGALIFLLVAFNLATAGLARQAAALVPQAAASALGDRLAGQIVASLAEREARPVDAMTCAQPEALAALGELLGILAQGPGREVGFAVRAIDTAEADLLALPGGQILLSGGAVAAAGDAETLAGLLAHQIGHVALDHPTARLLRTDPAGTLFALTADGAAGGAFSASLAVQLRRLPHEDGAERAADRFAVQLLNHVGVVAGPYAAWRATGSAVPGPGFTTLHPTDADDAEALRRSGIGQYAALAPERWQALAGLCR
ncbi:MAG: hypothetical protein HKM95_05745 [Inquilinus sp.]|nr:hypothetical protein [Inquilinus sp.]